MQQEEMLTAKEATKAFRDAGLSETTFRKRVKDGIIGKHMPEGRERGALYPKAQVLAAIDEAAKEPKKIKSANPLKPTIKPSTFSKAAIQDIPEIAALLETFFSRISIQKRAAWIERNPDIAYILRSEGKIVGCAFIIPLAQEKIMQILSSEVKPPTRPAEIALYEPRKPLYLYVRSVGILQAASKEQRRHWAARLISGLINEIIKLGTRGIIIEKIYAQTDIKQVEHTLKMLGFMQITSTTESKNFMLDIATSGSVFAMRYKKALNTWRAQNEEE